MTRQQRWTIVLSALIGLGAGGCETLRELTGDMAKPTASIRSVALSALTLDQATLDFDLEVNNPYGVPLPLADVDYGLSSGGQPFVSGSSDLSDVIPAGGSRVIRVPATVVFASLGQTLKGIRPGSTVPYTANLGISVDAPGAGRITLPIESSGEIPVPAVPKVTLERVEWQRIAMDEATALLKLHVVNENAFPVDLSELDYGLTLADRQVARANVRKAVSFGAGGANVIDIPISFAPADMGMAFLNALRGSGSGYDVSGTMKFGTPFGAMDLPFHRRGETTFVR